MYKYVRTTETRGLRVVSTENVTWTRGQSLTASDASIHSGICLPEGPRKKALSDDVLWYGGVGPFRKHCKGLEFPRISKSVSQTLGNIHYYWLALVTSVVY